MARLCDITCTILFAIFFSSSNYSICNIIKVHDHSSDLRKKIVDTHTPGDGYKTISKHFNMTGSTVCNIHHKASRYQFVSEQEWTQQNEALFRTG